jgi:tetratricopeptide (TPR) repeat protein
LTISIRKASIFRVCCACLFCFIILPFSVKAAGSADARIKVELAKTKYMANDYQSALLLLEEVIDQGDAGAEAYRYAGLCQVEMDSPIGAVDYLKKATELEPGNADIHEDLSWAGIIAKDYVLAEEAADRALEISPYSESAKLLRGQALMGQTRYEEASGIFEELSDSERKSQIALYYAGVCNLRMGKTNPAGEFFERSYETDPATELGQDAYRYANSLRAGFGAKKKTRPVVMRMRALYQYDTNVIPVHDSDQLPEDISDEKDGRVLLDIDGRYDFFERGKFASFLRYYWYNSWQEEADEFDLLYLLGGMGTTYKTDIGGRPFKTGTNAFYSFANMDGMNYSDNIQVSQDFTISWNSMTNTKFAVEYNKEDFNEDFFAKPSSLSSGSTADPDADEGIYSGDNDRDNYKIHLSLYQNFLFMDGKINTWVGYKWGRTYADGVNYDREDNGVICGIILLLWRDSQLITTVRYESRDFFNSEFEVTDSSDLIAEFEERLENRINVNLVYQYPLTKSMNVYSSVVYSEVDSNITQFEYSREIYSLGLSVLLD